MMQPLEETFSRDFPDYSPFPFGMQWEIKRLIRYILLAEPLLQEFGALFKGMSEQDIDALLQSFQFKYCVQRKELASIVAGKAQE